MKGYATSEGYMGLVQGRYMLFATRRLHRQWKQRFENDVKCMVFKQTLAGNKLHNRLRMM